MRSGFTLIEVLISLLVTGIILGIGSLSYRDFSRRQLVVGAARVVRQDLVETQQQALTGNKLGCTGVLDRYEVIRLSSTQYQIAARCSGPNATVIFKSTTMPANTQVDAFPTFSFKTVGEGTSISPGSVNVVVRAISGTGYAETINVDASGGIR